MKARFVPVVVALMLAASACGGGDGEAKRAIVRDVDPFESIDPTLPSAERAAPRWETVETFAGSADASEQMTIDDGAIQWRVSWTCKSGALQISARSDEQEEIVDGECPGQGRGTDISTGVVELAISASDDWEAKVEQQVDTPLVEAPLPEMEDPKAKVIASGDFHEIERRGSGTARLYRLRNGRLAVRLENFETSNNTDLFVWLSRAINPKTTRQVVAAPHVEAGLLKSTIGEHNYLVPKRLAANKIKSIVIWCEPVRIAYTAANLR